MSANFSKSTLFPAVVIIVGFIGVFFLNGFLRKNQPVLAEEYLDEDLSLKGAKLRGFALGMDGLLADWYWMNSLQYLGGKFAKTEENINLNDLSNLNPRLLYQYLDNATDLDPRFMEAYSFGATVLPAIDNSQAIELLQKGIAANPKEWRLYHYLGFIYWKIAYFDKAADIYEKGSQIQGAPNWMRIMSVRVKGDGASRETARAIYSEMLAQAADGQSKNAAESELAKLDWLDQRDAIRKSIGEFKIKNSRCPANWRELLPLLQSVKLEGNSQFKVDNNFNLVDPSGAPYVLNAEKCDVELDAEKTKIPLR